LALLGLAFAVAFITAKGAFVRWHYTFAFATALLFVFAFVTPNVRRRGLTLAFIAVFVAFLASTRMTPADFIAVRADEALGQFRTLVDPSLRHKAFQAAVDSMSASYSLEAGILDRLVDRRTHISPLEAGVAFAYPAIEWRPLPVFQDYSVYTPGLDDLNAGFLASSMAPERILRHPPAAIDGRNPWFEGPASQLAMLCRYVELDATDRWQVLARSDNRCGDPIVIATVEARVGQAVEVPNAPRGHILVARIRGLAPSAGDQLRSLVFKHDEWYITLDETAPYRLVSPTAAQGLLMAAPETIGYSQPFAPPSRIGSFKITSGHGAESSALLEVTFVAIKLGLG
jgi:hypothetical protein